MDGPHQLGKVKKQSQQYGSPLGWPSGACGFVPAWTGEEGRCCGAARVCLLPSLPAEVLHVTVRWGGVTLLRAGSVQAVLGELSKERLVPAGKGSFATCGIILTTFATQGTLSAQEAKRSQC